jgi:hypothetical protein
VIVKDAQTCLQKTITWTKKFEKGRQKQEKTCVESGLLPCKLKTPIKTTFASKIIMFEECIEFKKTIILCYGRKKTMALQ